MPVTWNPADKNADITLSGGDLTATNATASWASVRATTSRSTGKWYFESTVSVAEDCGLGVGYSTAGLTGGPGDDLDGWGFYRSGSASIFQIAIDLDTGSLWMGYDGIWSSGDPGAGTSPNWTDAIGTLFPMAGIINSATMTAHFAEADLTYSLPAGFTAWEGVGASSLPAESLAWTTQPLNIRHLPAESLAWTAQPLMAAVDSPIPAASLAWAAQPLQAVYDAPSFAIARAVYRCYLTGSEEDPPIADLELPLASFQSRRRNGEQTYLAITVPNPAPYIDAINARLNGDLVIYSGFAVGATETLTELLRVNFGSFRYDLGPRSGSASLSGHKQVTYSNPKLRALSGISYKSVTDGIARVRCEPDMWLNPGDTADLGGGESFVVDSISYIINPRSANMEVTEASE